MKKKFTAYALTAGIVLSGISAYDIVQTPRCVVSAEETKSEYIGSEYDNDYVYYIYADHVEIWKYFTEESHIVIPSEYNGLPITVIGSFANNEHLVEITLPDTITKISDKAFQNCPNLKKVNLSESLETIGEKAFYSTGITEINIPASVKEIGSEVFSAELLENISVSPDNPYFKDIDGSLFSKDGTVMIAYPRGKKNTFYEVPYGTKEICAAVFAWDKVLEEVYIPDSVEILGESAFYQASSLTVVRMSDKIKEIGSSTFSWCKKLEYITLPASLKTIGYCAFDSCDSLKHLVFPDGLEIIDDMAFSSCLSLNEFILPESVNYLGFGVFLGSSGDVVILNPDCNITDTSKYALGYGTVYGLPGSTAEKYAEQYYAVYFKTTDEWKNIEGQCGENAFFTIDYKGNMKITGTGDMYDCELIEEDGEIYIVSEIYDHRMKITSIDIADTITGIGTLNFMECINLRSVTLPKSVKSVGECAFMNCNMLREVVVNDPECAIYDGEDTIPSGSTIYGYKKSSAKNYADKYGLNFIPLDGVECDVNNDGVFNVADAVMLQKWIAKSGNIINWKAGDCNNDNKLDVFDAIAMKKKLNRII